MGARQRVPDRGGALDGDQDRPRPRGGGGAHGAEPRGPVRADLGARDPLRRRADRRGGRRAGGCALAVRGRPRPSSPACRPGARRAPPVLFRKVEAEQVAEWTARFGGAERRPEPRVRPQRRPVLTASAPRGRCRSRAAGPCRAGGRRHRSRGCAARRRGARPGCVLERRRGSPRPSQANKITADHPAAARPRLAATCAGRSALACTVPSCSASDPPPRRSAPTSACSGPARARLGGDRPVELGGLAHGERLRLRLVGSDRVAVARPAARSCSPRPRRRPGLCLVASSRTVRAKSAGRVSDTSAGWSGFSAGTLSVGRVGHRVTQRRLQAGKLAAAARPCSPPSDLPCLGGMAAWRSHARRHHRRGLRRLGRGEVGRRRGEHGRGGVRHGRRRRATTGFTGAGAIGLAAGAGVARTGAGMARTGAGLAIGATARGAAGRTGRGRPHPRSGGVRRGWTRRGREPSCARPGASPGRRRHRWRSSAIARGLSRRRLVAGLGFADGAPWHVAALGRTTGPRS